MLIYLIGFLALFQVQNFNIDYYNTQKGLSSNIVYDVHQDQQGFIWVATENGLNRFDAYEFKTFYNSETDPHSISSNVVRSIYESQDGMLWFGTRRGINLYEKRTQRFSVFLPTNSLNISSNDVLKLVPDSKENLWYLVQSRLISFDTKKRLYEEVHIPFPIYNMVIDINDRIWLSGFNGELYTFDIENEELKQIRKTSEDKNLSFFLGANKESILYNSEGQNIDIENWEEIPSFNEDAKADRFYEDFKRRRWFSSGEELYIQEGEGSSIIKVELGASSEPILSSIQVITEDKSGGIWIGSNDGLYGIKSKDKNFQKLNGESLRSFTMAIEESNNSWWVNYFSHGLSKYEINDSGRLIPSSNYDLIDGINQVWDLELVDDNKLWLASEKGLYELNTSTSQLSKIIYLDNDIEHEVFFVISRDDNNSFWVGGYSLILKIDSRSKKVLERIEMADEYQGALIQDIFITEDGLLIATETHGLFYYSKDSGLGKKLNESNIPQQLDQTSIWDIYESEDNKLWFGGNDGLYSLDSYENISNPIKADIGSNVIVFSITEDLNQILWLGTDKGLVRYNPDTGEYRMFDSGDGFENPEFNRRSIFTSKNGKIAVGGMSGLIYFDPEEININQDKPQVWITDFNVMTSDSILELGIYDKVELSLNWQQNTFEINFTALNYTNPLQNRYKYKLDYYDPDWVSPEESRVARYVRVPAGEYTFKVIASNNDGVWNELGDSINIKINPPFWQTYWFRLLLLVLVFVIAWLLYRFRVRQLLEVERVRLRIAGDLHDEIGSGLSGIALTGDLLQSQARKGTPKLEMIEKITTNARSLAVSLDSIVWLIDPNKETLLDLIIKCKRTANELLANHHLIIKDEVPESYHNKELPSEMRRNYYLIFKETAHNILKHAHAKKVEVLFSVENEVLIFSITDDGQGFDEQKVEKGKGLDGIKERSKEINAHLSLESQEGKGTVVSIQKALP